MLNRLRTLATIALVAAAAWACGSDSLSSPTAPTNSQSVSYGSATAGGTGPGSGTTTGPHGNPGHPPPGVVGTVGELSGTCPSLTFTLDGKTVKTNGETVFDESACTDVQNGVQAGAHGEVQADGSLLAAHVRVGEPPDGPGPNGPPPDGSEKTPPPGGPHGQPGAVGTVSGLAGTCPNLAFVLDGKTVKTNGETTFDDSSCSDVKNGVQAGAQGAIQSDGSLLAVRVRVGPPPAR